MESHPDWGVSIFTIARIPSMLNHLITPAQENMSNECLSE